MLKASELSGLCRFDVRQECNELSIRRPARHSADPRSVRQLPNISPSEFPIDGINNVYVLMAKAAGPEDQLLAIGRARGKRIIAHLLLRQYRHLCMDLVAVVR